MKLNTKKLKKRTLWLAILTFIFINIIAYNHAYRFTHFIEIDEIYKNLNGQKKLVTFEKSGHEDYLVNSNNEWLDKITTFVLND